MEFFEYTLDERLEDAKKYEKLLPPERDIFQYIVKKFFYWNSALFMAASIVLWILM
jgi:hypothetical protein